MYGLPLALELSKKYYKELRFDLKKERIKQLKKELILIMKLS